MNSVIEEAARHLCRWRGTGMAWHADVEWVSPDDPDNADGDRFPVARRGKVSEAAARSIAGGKGVGQQRTWVRSSKAAVMPCHRSSSDVSAALAMAKLEGPLEPILLLVCCEDLGRWPVVRRYAAASLRHRFSDEAATDAMHRILWRRPVQPLDVRAKSLSVRKADYARLRAIAEDLFAEWTLEGAMRFLDCLR